MVSLTINGQQHELDVPGQMPLLWVLRDVVHLTGTKYGCGQALCGACIVHLDGSPVPACVIPVSQAEGRSVTTIEAIGDDEVGRRVQQAWLDLAVAQCGFCQCGQIMSATALLKQNPQPDERQIDDAMNVNLCRCGTYNRIRQAIQRAADAQEDRT